jgi:hypothetical protein
MCACTSRHERARYPTYNAPTHADVALPCSGSLAAFSRPPTAHVALVSCLADAAFVPEWRAALPTGNLLIMRTEEQLAHPMRTLKRAVAFLGLRALRDDELRRARAVELNDDAARVRENHGLPDATTRAAVRAFYQPFNEALAAQLDDPGFLWQHVDGWTDDARLVEAAGMSSRAHRG